MPVILLSASAVVKVHVHLRVEERVDDLAGESVLLVLVLLVSAALRVPSLLTISTTARQYLATSGKWSDSDR